MPTPVDARIAILGSSINPARYSYKAALALLRKGYKDLVGVGPKRQAPEGIPTIASLAELPALGGAPLDTITFYVGPQISTPLTGEILAARPRRLIFNPGAENEALEDAARAAGIEVVEGCTLVMLSIGEF